MKTRTDFVTNSSSSSFVVIKALSHPEVIYQLENHTFAEYLSNLSWVKKYYPDVPIKEMIADWQMTDDYESDLDDFDRNTHTLRFWTSMNNWPLDDIIQKAGGFVIQTGD